MSTTENQGFLRLLTRFINRFFFRGKKEQQSFTNKAFKSFHSENLNQSHNSYHGDEEAFWFI